MIPTSYDQSQCFANQFIHSTCATHWFNLKCHTSINHEFQLWLESNPQYQPFQLEGAAGTGKTAWLQHVVRLNRHKRLRLVHAEFAPTEDVTPGLIWERWATCLSQWVDFPVRGSGTGFLREDVKHAVESLQLDGYQVLGSVESDQGNQHWQKIFPQFRLILLNRQDFHGSSARNGAYVLPHWSHDEIASFVSQKYSGLVWTDDVVGQIWHATLGRARDTIALVDHLANKANRLNSPQIQVEWFVCRN